MIKRRAAAEQERWFLEDRAIESATQDRLDHHAIATVLVEAVQSAHPPCMIGLLAEFGRGKSSTANMAVGMLNSGGSFDAVRVTADKHSGNARARNLVHAIAAELEQYQGLDGGRVQHLLRPLRQATEVAAPDPTTTALSRLISGRYEWSKLAISLAPFAVVALALALGAWFASGSLRSILGVLAASPLLIWIAALTFAPGDTPIGAMVKPGTQTDQTPRAEAADEIEEIFGQLVDYHSDCRKRRLVVFVDDIDRLSKDDLLDALRALRSLQSVPRGREPIIVIACNERIVESAVGSSTDHPAELSHDTNFNDGKEDTGLEVRSPDPLVPTGAETDHSHPALAFIDKLLTVRVQMPPTLRGDMRRFARDALAEDHPLRSQADIDLERILAVLIHDGVNDPRSVIRLVNRFVAAFLLGRSREASGRIYKGDVTLHLDVVAQLAVIVDEFPDFYMDVTRNAVLLEAASKAALSRNDLTPSEADALARSHEFEADSSQPSSYRFRQEALRRYLAGTARLVRYPVDVSPLVYFTATPGGRSLGVALRNRLVSALRVGDSSELAEVLSEVPTDRTTDAAQEIVDLLREGSAIDAPNYLAAVAPNLGRIPLADAVADASAELLERAPNDLIPVDVLTALLDHAGSGRDALLCERLTSQPTDLAAANDRYQQACLYLTGHIRVRQHVEARLLEWLDALPDQGGWALARPWLDITDSMDAGEHATLLAGVINASVHMVRDESGFSIDDAERLVQLVSTKPDSAGGISADQLTAPGPDTLSAFVRIWEITGHDGEPADARLAATAAVDSRIATPTRIIAVELLAAWVDTWKDGTYLVDDEETPVAPGILSNLSEVVADPAITGTVARKLSVLTEACGTEATEVTNSVLAQVELLRDENQSAEAEPLARSVIGAAASLPGDYLTTVSNRILSPIAPEVDPANDQVEMAFRLLAHIAPVPEGEAALSSVSEPWSNRIRSAGIHDDRCLLRGFQALASLSPAIVAQKAPPIYTQVEQLLNGNDDVPGRLRTLALFPWPEANVVGALNHLQAHWDAIPDDARLDTLRLSSRAPDGFAPLTFFNERVAELTSSAPGGPYAAIAARNLPRMMPEQREVVFAAAVGHHSDVSAAWTTTDDDEASEIIARNADQDDARRLLDHLPEERRPVVASQSLVKMATLAGVTDELVDVVASHTDESGLQQAAEVALDAAAQPANAESALRVAVGVTRRGITLNTQKVDNLIVALLPDGTDDVARLLGTAARKRTLSGSATDTLKQLRKSKSSAANAFDVAQR